MSKLKLEASSIGELEKQLSYIKEEKSSSCNHKKKGKLQIYEVSNRPNVYKCALCGTIIDMNNVPSVDDLKLYTERVHNAIEFLKMFDNAFDKEEKTRELTELQQINESVRKRFKKVQKKIQGKENKKNTQRTFKKISREFDPVADIKGKFNTRNPFMNR